MSGLYKMFFDTGESLLVALTAWPFTHCTLVKNYFQWHIPSLWAELHSGAGLHTVELIELKKIMLRSSEFSFSQVTGTQKEAYGNHLTSIQT